MRATGMFNGSPKKAYVAGLLLFLALVIPGAAHAQNAEAPTADLAAVPVEPDSAPDIDVLMEEAELNEEPPDASLEQEASPGLEQQAVGQQAGGAQVTALNFQLPASPLAKVDESSGGLSYDYSIALPAGRAGMTPEVTLLYSSRAVTKLDSTVGLGWDLPLPSIQRDPVRGTQALYSNAFFRSSLSGSLVATTDTSTTPYTLYRPETEDGTYLQYTFQPDQSWTVASKDGRIYTFGESAASRQDDPANPARVYRWMLSKVTDTHGNEIRYSYMKDQGQIYPAEIRYTVHPAAPSVHSVTFQYSSPAGFGSTSYLAAFPVTTSKLLSSIIVTTSVGTKVTTHTYRLTHTDAQFVKQKLVAAIERTTNFAANEYNQTFIDQTSFSYSAKGLGWEQGSHSLRDYLTYQDDTIFRDIYTADFDRNGYPDVFVSYRFQRTQSNYLLLNTGSQFVDVTASWGVPTGIDLSGNYVIVDLNGDHLPDLHPKHFDPRQPIPVYLNSGSGLVADSSGTWLMDNYLSEVQLCGPNVGDGESSGTNTFLYDINRDGRNDLVHFGGPSNFRVFLGDGSGWTETTGYTFTAAPGSTVDFSRNCQYAYPYKNYQTLLDVNGDGLEDYVHASFGTYLNTGAGFAYYGPYSLGQDEDMDRSGLADLNGDGLVDFISFKTYGSNRYSLVYLNNGSGFTLVNPSAFPNGTATTFWNPGELKFTLSNASSWGTLMDVTADGLPDIAGPFLSSTVGKVRAINDGQKTWVFNSNVSDPWKPIVTPSHGVFFDLNTDGVLDFIAPETAWDGQQQALSKVYMGKPTVPNRLVAIRTALGAETDIEYGTAPTDYSDTHIAPMPVVKRLTVQNLGQGQPSKVVRYDYQGGAYVGHRVTGQRTFAGFQSVTATESGADLVPLRITETSYHQGNGQDLATNEPPDDANSLVGKPYLTVVKHPSGSTKRETWQRYAVSPLATEPGLGRTVEFVQLTELVTKTTEAGNTNGTAELYSYDTTLGERIAVDRLGFVTVLADGSWTDLPGDSRFEASEFVANSARSIVKLARLDQRTSPAIEDTVARTEYFYDGEIFGNIGSFGDLTKEAKWLKMDGSSRAESVRTYDTFGNLATVTNPRGATTTYTYDSTQSLVATETNALGHQTSYQYVTGALTQVTNPNGFTTSYGYSSQGWPYRVTVPTNAGNRKTVRFLVEDLGGVFAFQTIQWPVATREDVTWEAIDNLGRVVRKVRKRTNHSTGVNSGYFLVSTNTHDPLGRAAVQGAPVGTSASQWLDHLTTVQPENLLTRTSYDIFDRPISVTNALGTTTFTYRGPETVIVDANGKARGMRLDAYGNLVRVDELNAGSTYTTRYDYDVRNLLVGVTDALGNVRRFTHNAAGWLTSSEGLHAPGDPDFGVLAFTYDAHGNQLTEQQPNGTVVQREFDLLDRPTRIAGTTVGTTEFTLAYDSCLKGIGRLCSVVGSFPNPALSFLKAFEYGASKPSREILTTQGATYVTSTLYTLSDEPTRITYPNGTVVRTTFGDWAMPATVLVTLPGGTETVFAAATYHPSLQPQTITVSGGPTLTTTYDDTKLYRKATFSATLGAATLASYSYDYDRVSNITQIVEMGLTKTYSYDDLYRLTSATHTPAAGASEMFTFAYDAVGNITSANGLAYSYSGLGKTNPHAVTSIGADTFVYDANGNVIVAPGQTLAYNWQNQVVSVVSGSESTVYAYDETGERFFLQTPATTEIQISDEYLLRGGEPEIVLKLGKLTVGLLKGGASFTTITDHLGTPVMQIDSSGQVVESTTYGPYGEVLASNGSLDSKRGYTGHEEDASTGLVYAEARYYSPRSKRFLQQDPSHLYLASQSYERLVGSRQEETLKCPQLLNIYSYSRGNPVNMVDRAGMLPVAVAPAIAGAGLSMTGPAVLATVAVAATVGVALAMMDSEELESRLRNWDPSKSRAETVQLTDGRLHDLHEGPKPPRDTKLGRWGLFAASVAEVIYENKDLISALFDSVGDSRDAEIDVEPKDSETPTVDPSNSPKGKPSSRKADQKKGD